MKAPTVTYTDHYNIAIAKDLIFGWCIFTSDGWKPMDIFNKATLSKVSRLLTNPIFPAEARDHVHGLLKAIEDSGVDKEDFLEL